MFCNSDLELGILHDLYIWSGVDIHVHVCTLHDNDAMYSASPMEVGDIRYIFLKKVHKNIYDIRKNLWPSQIVQSQNIRSN